MSTSLHGSCILLGEAGLLIRGASGAGKSILVKALCARWSAAGRFARLVADDRVLISVRAGRLIARPHPAIAGRIEMRGQGILAVPHEPVCVLRAIVDVLERPGERLPESEAATETISGVPLPVARLMADQWLIDRLETFWFQTYL